jgi:pilus assembly protein Flp/PilA
MLSRLRNFFALRHSERGASAVEYGLLVAGIAALVVVAVFALGDNIKDVFDDTCSSVAADTACNAN